MKRMCPPGASRSNPATLFLAVAALAAAVLVATARASVTITLDVLDFTEPGPWPPGSIAVVDVLVDVTEDDVWMAAGLRVTTLGGATIRYSHDPNTLEPVVLNPGTADRFVTCISRPRARHGDARFTNAQAAWAGRYCPTGPSHTATATEFNVAWFASPPPSAESPSADGAIARIALDIEAFDWCACCYVGVFPASQVPVGYIWVAQFTCEGTSPGVVSTTFDAPSTVGDDWILAIDRAGPYTCPWSIDPDTDVDLEDLAYLLTAFGHCIGEPGFIPAADFDLDGCIRLSDLTVLLAHFGLPCC